MELHLENIPMLKDQQKNHKVWKTMNLKSQIKCSQTPQLKLDQQPNHVIINKLKSCRLKNI